MEPAVGGQRAMPTPNSVGGSTGDAGGNTKPVHRAHSKKTTVGSKITAASWLVRARANLQVEDPVLLRGMPLANGLRSFAGVLSDRAPTAEYYALSAPVESIHTFVSHNWQTPRWQKFLVLTFHFNLLTGFTVGTAVAALACYLTVEGLLPTHVMSTAFFHGGEEYTQGILCLPLGLLAFFLALFGVHELDCILLPWRHHKLFIDKCCVHQTNEELKRKGIEGLAAFLSRSENILCLYTDVYLQKLWTVYEVASWLLLHQGEPMMVRPVILPMVLLCGVAVMCAFEACNTLSRLMDLPLNLQPITAIILLPLVLGVPTFTVLAWLLAKLAIDRDRIDEHLSKFRLADAKCANEDDRVVVQKNIVAFMKLAKISAPEDDEADVFDLFEELVREEVPKLMASSFSRVDLPYQWAVIPFIPHMFLTFDLLAGLLLDCHSLRGRIVQSVFFLAVITLACPLVIALIAILTRHHRLRNIPACIGIGVLATFLLTGAFQFFHAATDQALQSNVWLAVLLTLYGFCALGTWMVYRPRPFSALT